MYSDGKLGHECQMDNWLNGWVAGLGKIILLQNFLYVVWLTVGYD